MLTKRDNAILKDLKRFRVMDRDSISEIHFAGLKNPHHSANNVLLRLLREGHVQRSHAFVPYVWFPADSKLKQNSQKIGHYLAILNVYKEMRRLGRLGQFLVEPRFGSKGTVEVDAFALFRDTPFFLEIQLTRYSQKQMDEKLQRYIDFYHSGVMEKFPRVLILSDDRYALDGDYPFKLFQAPSFTDFIESLQPKKEPQRVEASGGIRMVIK